MCMGYIIEPRKNCATQAPNPKRETRDECLKLIKGNVTDYAAACHTIYKQILLYRIFFCTELQIVAKNSAP